MVALFTPWRTSLNLQKHGISFETAKIVFDDPLAYIFDDEWHYIGELREIIIGHDQENRLLLVCFTERTQVIRIISARLATIQNSKFSHSNILDSWSLISPRCLL